MKPSRLRNTMNQVSFPWWPSMPDFDAITAYTAFLSALCKMSKKQKRITAKAKPIDNEKYAFRCFLLRLGFIGDEYKQSRRILCRYLCGNSSYAGGEGMLFANRAQVERLRLRYPIGTRVELVEMDDAQAPPIGTQGTVTGVDDTGSLLVDWDNGSGLNVIYGVDQVKKL